MNSRGSPAASSFLAANSGEVCRIERRPAGVGRDQLGRERMQVCLVAGRSLEDRGLDLGKILGRKPRPER